MLNVSHFLGRCQLKQEFHKELIHNFMEPRAVFWILFIKLGRRHRSGQNWRCRLEAAVRDGDVHFADDGEANKAWCVDRQELFLYLTSQLLQDKHTWTHRPGLQERDVCTLLLAQIFSWSSWLGTGWLPRGWRHSSCMPVPISQIQVFPGLLGSSVLHSWAFVHEKGSWLLFNLNGSTG